jgi:hypothetical protein
VARAAEFDELSIKMAKVSVQEEDDREIDELTTLIAEMSLYVNFQPPNIFPS